MTYKIWCLFGVYFGVYLAYFGVTRWKKWCVSIYIPMYRHHTPSQIWILDNYG